MQIINNPPMIAEFIDVDLGKILQAFAGEVGALETPGYLLILGTLAKTAAAVNAAPIHMIGKAFVATYFLDRHTSCLGHFLQFFSIVTLICNVFTSSVLQPTNPYILILSFFSCHCIFLHIP